MEQFQVVEKFISINGEGPYAGQLAVFIRFKGCNLCCSYCDTLWANQENCQATILAKEEIGDYIRNAGVCHVTLTGGEPLLQNNINSLIDFLLEDESLTIEIETNGSMNLWPIKQKSRERLSLTMDYKLPSSSMESFMLKENLKILDKQDTVKFVAGSLDDLTCAKEIMKEYELRSRTRVFISPVYGSIHLDSMVEWMKRNQMNDITLQLQLHKIIWGSEAKGV